MNHGKVKMENKVSWKENMNEKEKNERKKKKGEKGTKNEKKEEKKHKFRSSQWTLPELSLSISFFSFIKQNFLFAFYFCFHFFWFSLLPFQNGSFEGYKQ